MKTMTAMRVFVLMAGLVAGASVGLGAQTKQPDRALVVLRTDAEQAFASWRALGADAAGTMFVVELADRPDGPFHAVKTTGALTNATLAVPGGKAAYVRVRVLATGQGGELTPAVPVPESAAGYISIPLAKTDRAQKVGLGDFDGDGKLDYLVKTPDFNTDPYQQPGYWKQSTDTYKLPPTGTMGPSCGPMTWAGRSRRGSGIPR
ncbi:MAG: hypothetical protein NTV51_29935 [Verrucomicrobia bacterium]|nr:hypothetical protein [Verrucomicrobiota bacterium]